MTIHFTTLICKLIEFDKQSAIHNQNILLLKEDYFSKENDIVRQDSKTLSDKMSLLGLAVSSDTSALSDYQDSKRKFFQLMIETDCLLKQIKALIKAFLDYDLIIDHVDVSKMLTFTTETILSQISIYPKRLTLLLKRGYISENLYNSIYSDSWLNQSVKGCNGLLRGLLKQYEALNSCYFPLMKNKDVSLISEDFYRGDILPTMKKLSAVIEYLICPKIDLSFSAKQLVDQYGFLTDESVILKCNQVNKII